MKFLLSAYTQCQIHYLRYMGTVVLVQPPPPPTPAPQAVRFLLNLGGKIYENGVIDMNIS